MSVIELSACLILWWLFLPFIFLICFLVFCELIVFTMINNPDLFQVLVAGVMVVLGVGIFDE